MLNQRLCSLAVADLVSALPLIPSDLSAMFAGHTFLFSFTFCIQHLCHSLKSCSQIPTFPASW